MIDGDRTPYFGLVRGASGEGIIILGKDRERKS